MPWLGTMGEGEGMSPTMGGGTKDMGKGSTDRYLGHLKTVWEGFLFVSTHGLTLGSRGCFFCKLHSWASACDLEASWGHVGVKTDSDHIRPDCLHVYRSRSRSPLPIPLLQLSDLAELKSAILLASKGIQ